MGGNKLHEGVRTFRRFNRFYTNQAGFLDRGLLRTRFRLTQARILYELAQHPQTTARDISNELKIDPGYLSRILSNFEKEGLLRKIRSKSDSRQRLLQLTARGRKSFEVLNEKSSKQAEMLLTGLSAEDRHRLLSAMETVEIILGNKPETMTSYLLRPHEPGDIGWIIYRHGVVYAQEYGFDETFEALVAEILVKFILEHQPARERLWIAEKDGERIGSIMIVDAGHTVAQLRLLFVEPSARGIGVGKRLIDECIHFSRRKRYRKIKLWTQSRLLQARRLYARAGFELVETSKHRRFDKNVVGEVWELPLKNE
jgi:DNA-binding MarR family transcriptional regulator/ribosomal protein S18 acetylase RimI-like enzyme